MEKGIVEKIATKKVTTKFGLKDTFSLKIGGEWYSAGFKRPPVGEGDNVSFDYDETTYGKQIKSISATIAKLGAAPAPAAAAPSRGGYDRSFPVALLSPERAIIRQNALAHATRLYAQGSAGVLAFLDEDCDLHTGRIIKMAREFEAYACGDTEREEA